MAPAVKIGLLALQGVQVVFLLLHDWVPLGRLSNLKAIRASDPPGRLLVVTLLSALPFALVFGVCCAYWKAPHWPAWLETWLWYTYGAALLGTLFAWWGPYLFWQSPERAERYRARFAGTMKFLPERNGFAPDALHVAYHLCIVGTVVLLTML
ncbi:MAG TPA: hypothetical protein VGM02_03615 [Acidobacteriaceae bacterium]|jgi:hypothetical protein